MRARPPVPAAVAAAALFVLGCTAADGAPDTDPPPAAPNVVHLAATDFAFDAPDTVAAGWTTFRMTNDGTIPHHAQLVRLADGRTLEEYVEAYSRMTREGASPPEWWGGWMGGPGMAEPGAESNATQYLEPGRYAWLCFVGGPEAPHLLAGMSRAFVVTGDGAPSERGDAPDADLVVRMDEYAFELPAPVPVAAGAHTVRVENAGAEPHELILGRLDAGTTMDDLMAWMRDQQGPPPATAVGGVGGVAAGGEAYFDADLEPGDYVLVCFVPAPDGRPHVAHGMIRHLPVG